MPTRKKSRTSRKITSQNRWTKKRAKYDRSVQYDALEPRQLLATLAEAGIGQRSIDLINNQGVFAGQFEGREGTDNSNPINPLTPAVLNDVAFQHAVDGVAESAAVPSGAQMITSKTQLLNNIAAGSVGNPNVYHVLGDFSLATNETIDIPSNVSVFVEGSIFKAGSFTSTSPFGSPEAENSTDFIFTISGSDNVKLVGVDNAYISGTPTVDPNDTHPTAFRITGSANNVTVDGFEMAYLWQGVDARIGSSEVVVSNNYIHDIVKRAIWFLGTTDSVAVHNFIVNPGVDGIDFDAYTANSTAYENVVIGAGRFAFFVEEGANNNFSVRQLAIMYRFAGQSPVDGDFSESSNPTGFQLGNTSNGTSDGFYNSNLADDPTLYTRDNFFLDNLTLLPTSQSFRVGGDYVATGDNGFAGNSYFFGNRGYGVGSGSESAPFGRDLMFKAIYNDQLSNREFIAATNGGFENGANVSSFGYNSYDLVDVLNGLDSTYNATTTPIRSEILPAPKQAILFEESGGKVVIEAENFSDRNNGTGSADGRFFNLLLDDSVGGTEPDNEAASGDIGLIAEINPDLQAAGTGVNTGNSLDGPRVDYDILFQTPGDYRVFLRTLATTGDDNSVHIGLNGSAVTTGAGTGVGTSNTTWTWVDDVVGGTADVTISVTTPGIQTLNVWMREDGVQIDKIILDIAAATPTGFGPAESPLVAAQSSGRFVAYNNSAFDSNDPNANASDDATISPDKVALLPGETATFANYTSYVKGINTIMIDGLALSDPGAITSDDFVLRTGNGSTNASFTDAGIVPAVSVRLGEGGSGSDRITLTLPDNAIRNTWLQVTMLANEKTGLAAQDVFYFGNVVGETGNDPGNARVDLLDVSLTRSNQSGFSAVGTDSIYDLNRDTRVNLLDVALARSNQSGFTTVNLITAPDGSSSGRSSSSDKGGGSSGDGFNSKQVLLFQLEQESANSELCLRTSMGHRRYSVFLLDQSFSQLGGSSELAETELSFNRPSAFSTNSADSDDDESAAKTPLDKGREFAAAVDLLLS